MPISTDPAHLVTCWSTHTSKSSLGPRQRLVRTTALLNSSLALRGKKYKSIYRRHYMTVKRHKNSLGIVQKIFHKWAQQTSEIFFNMRRDISYLQVTKWFSFYFIKSSPHNKSFISFVSKTRVWTWLKKLRFSCLLASACKNTASWLVKIISHMCDKK